MRRLARLVDSNSVHSFQDTTEARTKILHAFIDYRYLVTFILISLNGNT